MAEDITVEQIRFKESGNGIIVEPSKGLMWMKNDTYQLTKKWMSWIQTRDYIQELNRKKFAGYGNWRMPTTSEARSLYDKNHSNKDHWGQHVP
ncbi:uncharacterized protein METZ01_LOCUS376503, partial [marine metagenome]